MCFALLCVGVLFLSGCLSERVALGPVETRSEDISLVDTTTEANVDLSFGVGSLTIGSTDEALFSGEFRTNVEKLFPAIEQTEKDQIVQLKIKPERSVANITGNVKNDWDMLFSNQLP
ncbi:MAG: toast rack family protein [Bacillaceae bacterium]|nr:toast rack family protein [Bacillaceae bacterium]